jgi:hypothetical protein
MQVFSLMVSTGKICSAGTLPQWALIGVFMAATAGWAGEFRLESAGGRVGFPANPSAEGFHQAEAFVNWNLPWHWDLGRDWRLQSRLDVSAGWLGRGPDNAAIATLGPSLALGWQRLPVSLEGGISPTVISLEHFKTKDLGTDFQFTSHLGVNWDFASRMRLGYRYQHMSNAGIGQNNPGLNLHLVALSYVF